MGEKQKRQMDEIVSLVEVSWSQTNSDHKCCLGLTKKPVCPHQEPVDVHEQQRQEKSVEEEVKGDAGDGLEAGHTRGIQHFEREPVETEPEPESKGDRKKIRQQK